MAAVKRKYESPKRREQADATRRHLAAAAKRRFSEEDYATTTIASIAGEAGMAVQTFYATYGSKRAVLSALLDEVDAEADVPGLLEELERSASDPRRQLRNIVEFNARLFQGAADVLEVLRGAGSADPDLASVWREGEERRRKGQAPLVSAWSEAGALRPGLGEREAADVMWVLTGPDTYRLFVTERGWSVARYREWLTATLELLLFER